MEQFFSTIYSTFALFSKSTNEFLVALCFSSSSRSPNQALTLYRLGRFIPITHRWSPVNLDDPIALFTFRHFENLKSDFKRFVLVSGNSLYNLRRINSLTSCPYRKRVRRMIISEWIINSCLDPCGGLSCSTWRIVIFLLEICHYGIQKWKRVIVG